MKDLIIFIVFFFLGTSLAYPQRLIKIGQEEIKNKNYLKAIEALNSAIKKYPKAQSGYFFLSIAYRANNQLTEAEGALLDGIAIGGEIDYKLYFELGNILFKRGEGYYSLAIKYYSHSIKSRPNYDKALLNRANAYVEQGKIAYQEKDYQNAWDSYAMAIHDYSQFITLKSETEKKDNILHMISLLRNEKANLEKLDKNLKGQTKHSVNTKKDKDKILQKNFEENLKANSFN